MNTLIPVEGLQTVFSTKERDLSFAAGQREAWFLEHGVDPGRVAQGRQVHGTAVASVREGGVLPDTDGVVTSERNLALAVVVADCAAILVADPEAGVIGAFHAGWRGAVGGIQRVGLRQMEALGGRPRRMRAWISPCLGVGNFEVGEEVAERFPSAFVHRSGYSKPHVDLAGYLIHELADAGIPPQHIQADGRCTVAGSGLFHSYRRDASASGRMMAMIRILP